MKINSGADGHDKFIEFKNRLKEKMMRLKILDS